MTQSVDEIVKVFITAATTFPDGFDFGSANILGTSDVISTEERIRVYNDSKSVLADFGSTSEEYKSANIFFSRNPRPVRLHISRWVNTASKANLLGGLGGTELIAEWMIVTDGSFRITVDGVAANVTGLDFSGSTSFDNVASVVQTGLQAAGFANSTCVYNANEKRFVVASGTSGVSSTISTLTTATASVGTDISGLGGSKFLNGAAPSGIAINGLNAESVEDALGIIEQKNNTWYMLSCTKSIRDDSNVLGVASWVSSRRKLYFTVTNDTGTLDANNTTNVAYLLNQLNHSRVVVIYNKDDQYSDSSLMSYGAVNDAGSTTWKFKELSAGITPSNELTSTQSNIAKSRESNVYTTVSGVNMISEGVVANGEFIDIVRGIDALQFEIQRSVFGRLAVTGKIPYTDAGVALLIAEVELILQKFTNSNFLAPRNIFDSNGEYLNTDPAFTVTAIPVFQVPPAQRADRVSPDINFTAYLAGAIHFVTIRGLLSV